MAARALPKVCNGNWAEERVIVYNHVGYAGRHYVDDHVNLCKFVADAMFDAGLFGGLCHKKPAKSRWGTLTAACVAVSSYGSKYFVLF